MTQTNKLAHYIIGRKSIIYRVSFWSFDFKRLFRREKTVSYVEGNFGKEVEAR